VAQTRENDTLGRTAAEAGAQSNDGTAPLAAVWLAPGMTIAGVNDALCVWSGHYRVVLEGAPAAALFHTGDLAGLEECCTGCLGSHLACAPLMVRVRLRGGGLRYVEAAIQRDDAPDGTPAMRLEFDPATAAVTPEDALRETEQRLRRHNEALMALAQFQLSTHDTSDSIREIVATAARTLHAQRASIWLFNAGNTVFSCIESYDVAQGFTGAEGTLLVETYPEYFEAVGQDLTIAAHNAYEDPRTRCLRERYLEPLGITSMLDAPVRSGGRPLGVLCVEHIGPPRHWSLEEQHFVASLADLVAVQLALADRRAAEEDLQRRERYYRSLIENSHDMVVIRDAEGAITYVSPASTRLFGFEPDDVLGFKGLDYVHPDDRDRIEADFRKLLESPEGTMASESRIYDAHGRLHVVESIARNLVHDPAVQGVVINLRDITDRKEAEQALRQREQYFRKLIENAPDMICVTDAQGILHYASPSVQRVMGHDLDTIVGRDCIEFAVPDDQPAYRELLARVLAAPGQVQRALLRCYNASGRVRDLEYIAQNLLDEPGVERIVVNFRDVTDRIQAQRVLEDYSRTLENEVAQRVRQLKQKNDELEQALEQLRAVQSQLVQQEKMASLGVLTAGIAHEIRNPLNFITNFAEISVELAADLHKALDRLGVTGDGDVAALLTDILENVGRIRSHGQRADRIVSGMLAHFRGSTGKPEDTDINALVDTYVRLAYHGIRARDRSANVAIDTDYAADAGAIRAVPQNLSRAILNIVSNACAAVIQRRAAEGEAYTPRVTVSTRRAGDGVEIRVHDNGPGIPADIVNKIFNPFFTTKAPGEGTGLGLSIAYDVVVHEHRGELLVDSTEGSHTTFTLRLPRDAWAQPRPKGVGQRRRSAPAAMERHGNTADHQSGPHA